ncbi:MAG: hypothetical protein ACYT04_45670 [Nostoc sp.]
MRSHLHQCDRFSARLCANVGLHLRPSTSDGRKRTGEAIAPIL